MKLGFFTDPHLGVERTGNTTSLSRTLMRQHVYDCTLSVIDNLRECGAEKVYCLGDLLDKSSNDEDVIQQAGEIVQRIDGVLAGNHDIRNRVDKLSTLGLLRKLMSFDNGLKIVASANPAQPSYEVVTHNNDEIGIVFVPHVLSQAVFEESVKKAIDVFDGRYIQCTILCLHCNVSETNAIDTTKESTTLFLTAELAAQARTAFNFVLVGHEHVPKQEDNLYVLGNVFPLSFGEIADRFGWILDTEKMTMERKVFSFVAESDFADIEAADMLSTGGAIETRACLVSVNGVIKKADSADMARALQKFWKVNPDLFMVRNATQIEGAASVQDARTFVPRTLSEIVDAAVDATPYREEYREAREAVEHDEKYAAK